MLRRHCAGTLNRPSQALETSGSHAAPGFQLDSAAAHLGGWEVLFGKTRIAGARGICCRGAFDLCSPETSRGDAGRRSLKPIQQAITSIAATPTAVSHRPLYHGTHFARFNTAQAECVSAGNLPARAMKVPKAWYLARLVAAAGTDARSLR